MKYNENTVFEPGNQYPKAAGDVAPFATLPAWWRRFIFQVLNGRELQVYLYLVMMVDADNAVAYPTISSIQRDMGLASDTQVFEALRNLEKYGFILRQRTQLPNRYSRFLRNVYQRAAPEFTLLQLLKRGRVDDGIKTGEKAIDEFLNFATCPTPEPADPFGYTTIPKDIARGLMRLLGMERYQRYAFIRDGNKRAALIDILQERFDERVEASKPRYANLKPAPRDRQREESRKREVAFAEAGGLQPAPPAPYVLTDLGDVPF